MYRKGEQVTMNLSGKGPKKVHLRELKETLKASDSLIHNLDRMSEESLIELSSSVKELKSQKPMIEVEPLTNEEKDILESQIGKGVEV